MALSVVKSFRQSHSKGTLDQNKANAISFYDMVFNKHQPAKAFQMYIGKEYIQHNFSVADGVETFVTTFESFLKQFYQSKVEIKRIVTKGKDVIQDIPKETTSERSMF